MLARLNHIKDWKLSKKGSFWSFFLCRNFQNLNALYREREYLTILLTIKINKQQ